MEKEINMAEMTSDLIKHALDQDYNKANEIFGEIMSAKMNDMLDQEKISMADKIYNDVGPDQLELDLGDQDDADTEEAEAASEPVADTESGDEEVQAETEESGEVLDDEVESSSEDDNEEEREG